MFTSLDDKSKYLIKIVSIIYEPSSYEEAIKNPELREAMKKGFDAL